MKQPRLYIIAGCNGAGKTTASYTLFPKLLECNEFVNADEIAKGISPFNPEKVAISAGKIMLNRIDELLKYKTTFAFETTLATKIYQHKIQTAKSNGYKTILIFFWLKNVEIAKERVKIRVFEGGHNIPTEIIERRYINGIKNLFNIYINLVDEVLIYDNSKVNPDLILTKINNNFTIINNEKYNLLKEYGK